MWIALILVWLLALTVFIAVMYYNNKQEHEDLHDKDEYNERLAVHPNRIRHLN